MGYSTGKAIRHGSNSPTRFTGQSALMSRKFYTYRPDCTATLRAPPLFSAEEQELLRFRLTIRRRFSAKLLCASALFPSGPTEYVHAHHGFLSEREPSRQPLNLTFRVELIESCVSIRLQVPLYPDKCVNGRMPFLSGPYANQTAGGNADPAL